jgi:hypothetical protein
MSVDAWRQSQQIQAFAHECIWRHFIVESILTPMPLLSRLLVIVAFCCAPAAAFAHVDDTSYLRIQADSAQGVVRIAWDLNAADIDSTVDLDFDTNGFITYGELQESRAAIERLALQSLKIERGAAVCPLSVSDVTLTRHTDATFVTVAMKAQCPAAGLVAVSSSLFFSPDASQRVLVALSSGGQKMSGVLTPLAKRWVQPAEPPVWETFARYFGEGVWHMTIGFDHILFALLLFVPMILRGNGSSVKDVLSIVGMLTIVHTISLALTATHRIVLPGLLLEVAIALSVVAALLLSFYPALARWRAPIACTFGLMHGFAFAQSLSNISSGTGLIPLIAGFNLGIACALLLLVALAAAPLKIFLSQSPHRLHLL